MQMVNFIKSLRKNSADRLTYITDGMANIDVCKKKSCSLLLQAVDTEGKMVHVAFTCSINHRIAARAEPNRYTEDF